MNTTTTPQSSNNDTQAQQANLEQLGPYRLDELIVEQNGYAVFSATHSKRKHSVTLYVLPALRGEGLDAFQQDVEAAERINHPSVAKIVDSGEFEGFPYVAYEHIDGISVERITKLERKLSASVACAIVRQAAIGLHHIHENGLLHGGMGPANLMVTKTGVVKILSLAVAAHTAEHPTRPNPSDAANYLAPEQLVGHAEPRSDIYGLGCTLFNMVSGQSPQPCVERSKSDNKLPLNEKEIGPSLVSVIQAMMDIDPTKRVQLLTQVVGAMCNWASEDTLPKLVTKHMQDVDLHAATAFEEPPRVARPIDQEAAAQANPKDVEITPPPSPVGKIGPAVGVLAIVLAASFGAFLYIGGGQPKLAVPTAVSANATANQAPLQTRLALPKRVDTTAEQGVPASDAAVVETSAPVAPGTSQADTPAQVAPASETPQAAVVNTVTPTATAETTEVPTTQSHQDAPQVTETVDPNLQEQELAQGQAIDIGPTETIAASLNLPEVVDKSVDAYHNRLQRQLLEEYGLSGGKWVLTPNEFALISSVVSYGGKVSQDETTDEEDFGRLVRMHIAGKGAKPWASGLYIPEIDGIEKGDRVLVVAWLRTSPGSKTSEGKVGIFVESASDHKKEVYLTVKPTSEWRQFLIPFQAKVARDLRVGFHLAFQKQDIDYGGLTLINFGKTAPFWNAIPAGPRRRNE